MNIKEFFSNYTNHPVLFIGSGFSLRYIKDFKDWDGLLSEISYEIFENEEKYLDIKSKNYFGGQYRYDKVASFIEKMFNEYAESNRDGKFKSINDDFYDNMRRGENISRFKLYLSQKLKEFEIKPEMVSELAELKKVRKNISSVVTTNYDTLIEQVFNFNPLIGNNILLSNPYGSVYKIHGCVTSPKRIIINEEDYKSFQLKYELIRSQLMSLFIHNPIIFFGYSISDSNIKELLKTIFTYVEPNSDLSNKIRNNFLLVEYEKDSTNLNVVEHVIEIEGLSTISINKLKTDDFTSIYKELARLRLPVSAMDIRKVQNVVKQITIGNEGIKVSITEDLESLQNSDKILVIGSSNTIKYEYQNKTVLLVDYFKILEEENAGLIQLIDKFKIQSTQYYPIYGFSKINNSIASLNKLKTQQINKLKQYIDSKNMGTYTIYNSIEKIFNDHTIAKTYKYDNILYSVLYDGIALETLKDYLISFIDKKETAYKRLLCIYDILKYAEDAEIKKLKSN